eukprot:SAG31_NODE_39133_length_290_cov_1.361257_1_plen_31_part_01
MQIEIEKHCNIHHTKVPADAHMLCPDACFQI